MSGNKSATKFAPAERAPKTTISRQARLFYDTALLQKLYDSVTDIVLIVNCERQIIFCNESFVGFLGIAGAEQVYGLRPGEAFKCSHAFKHDGGCGTSEHCSTCDAVRAVLSAQLGKPDARQCRILREDGLEALDILVRTTPLKLAQERFVICAISDISDQKRRRALERVFFHDLLNTAEGMRLLCESDKSRRKPKQVLDNILKVTRQLIEEISAQRDLAAAESGEMQVHKTSVRSRSLLKDLAEQYERHAKTKACLIKLDQETEELALFTDGVILGRVLANMIKNAVEACKGGQTVTIGCRRSNGDAEFWVHNPGCISRSHQLQIFQRSFSTKGEGRGLGTYSMKLLTRKYLGGLVDFTTSADDGTVFRAIIPVESK